MSQEYVEAESEVGRESWEVREHREGIGRNELECFRRESWEGERS